MNLNPFAPIFDLIDTAVDKIFPDADAEQKRKADKFMAELKGKMTLALGQIETNKVEAAHSSVFVSGWRPFIGWVCGAGLAYSFLVYPLLLWVFGLLQASEVIPMFIIAKDGAKVVVTAPPPVEIGVIFSLVTGMLGLGATRSYEKKQGVARLSIKGGV